MPQRSRDYGHRDDHGRISTGHAPEWGFGKAASAFAVGALTAPDNVVTWDCGPAFNAGAGQACGEITADWSFDEIASGDWVVWERHFGKVYVSALECPPEA